MPITNDDDRFGMPQSAFQSAHQANADIPRMGMLVPNRAQVRTMSAKELSLVLDFWMYESPAELIPSDDQIRGVITELEERADRQDDEVVALIASCREYLDE